MGKDSPPPVDYAAQAQAQAQANKDTAGFNNNANRVDQITPLGSSTWTIKPGADPNNPQPGDYVQTTALAPGQQTLFNSQNALSNNLANVANAGVGRVADAMGKPFDTSGLPALQGAPAIQQTATPGAGLTMGLGAGGPLTSSVATQPIAGANDFGAQRDQVVNALMSRITPDLQRGQDTLDTNLANKGIDLGSTAYTRAQDLQGRTANDAKMGAILAGGQEQSRLANLDMAANAQTFGQGLANANLGNTAQGTQFQQGLASAQFGNQAQGQQFNQQSQTDAAVNALLGRNVGIANTARQQGISEEAYLRSLPLNELNSLRSGSQVAMPTFGQYYSSGAQPAPIMDAAIAQGNQNNAINAQNNASTNAAVGSAAALAGSTASYWLPALMALSDERLKTDLIYMGRHPLGVTRYQWQWKDGSGYGVGVIAQDVAEVMPEAVLTGPDGFLRVNYAMIGGR